MRVVAREELDAGREDDPVSKGQAAREEDRRDRDEGRDDALRVLLDRGCEETPELPEDHGQRQREAGPEAHLDRGDERLRHSEGDGHLALRQGDVQPLDQVVVEDEGDDEADPERGERDQEPGAELVEVLDE